MHTLLNEVLLGVLKHENTEEALEMSIDLKYKEYLALVYRRANYNEFMKKLCTPENIDNLREHLPVPVIYNSPSYDVGVFELFNVSLKLYLGQQLNKSTEYPQSTAVYYRTAPQYSFRITLTRGAVKFENLNPQYLHPHSTRTDAKNGVFGSLCVGHHTFLDAILHNRFNNSTDIMSALHDMFAWLLEVNLHDNYGTLLCSGEPNLIWRDPQKLKDFVFETTETLIESSNVDRELLRARDYAYAEYLLRCTLNGDRADILWERNVLENDVRYYNNNPRTLSAPDKEHLYAPLTYREILNITRNGGHYLC